MFSPRNVTKQTIHFLKADISQIPELQVLSHSGQISLNQPQKKTINMVLCVYMCPHNLQFDGLAIQLDGANLKVHSNGADVALCVGVILQKEEGQHDLVRPAAKPVKNIHSVQQKWKISYSEEVLLTAKRSRRQDFPTPESPMSRSLNR